MSILSSPSSNCPCSSQAPQSIGWVHAQDQEEQCQPQPPPASHSALTFRQPGPYLTLKAIGLGFWLEMRSPVDFFFPCSALFPSFSSICVIVMKNSSYLEWVGGVRGSQEDLQCLQRVSLPSTFPTWKADVQSLQLLQLPTNPKGQCCKRDCYVRQNGGKSG